MTFLESTLNQFKMLNAGFEKTKYPRLLKSLVATSMTVGALSMAHNGYAVVKGQDAIPRPVVNEYSTPTLHFLEQADLFLHVFKKADTQVKALPSSDDAFHVLQQQKLLLNEGTLNTSLLQQWIRMVTTYESHYADSILQDKTKTNSVALWKGEYEDLLHKAWDKLKNQPVPVTHLDYRDVALDYNAMIEVYQFVYPKRTLGLEYLCNSQWSKNWRAEAEQAFKKGGLDPSDYKISPVCDQPRDLANSERMPTFEESQTLK
jgi:hypothetical protein